MHPEPQHHDVSRDPILDGRDSLRLVKLRLGLTLIAVAVLPIAAVSPLVRAVAEEARVTHHERLADQASTAVAEFEREIALVRSVEQELLGDPTIGAAAGDDAGDGARIQASIRLQDLVVGPGAPVLGATLLTADGIKAEFGPSIDLKALPP